MSQDIISQIDEHLEFLHRSRAVFPYIPEKLVGQTEIETAPYYQGMGLKYLLKFSEPLTLEQIRSINDLGHWVNQNFIVRLYAVLESKGLISDNIKIRPNLSGNEEVDIVRRLRNLFGHGSGNYDQMDTVKKKLFDRIRTQFNLNCEEISKIEGKFPLPINQVLVPLAQGCKRYAVEIEKADNPNPN